jgi:CHAT domain-containing protein
MSAAIFTPSIALQQAQALLEGLPASRAKAYALIRLATLNQWVKGSATLDPATHCLGVDVPLQTIALLQQAIAIAQTIHDSQSEAFALGRLGHVYECRQEYGRALTLTQQAQLLAANDDSRYLWEWQSGRILHAQGNKASAIAAYALAVKTLQTLRGELAIASRDFQFDFRDTVEPVYRELTALYLEQATGSQTQAQQALEGKSKGKTSLQRSSVTTIESALETIDNLRLVELQNYLGEDCTLSAIARPVAVVDQKTAVLSSIMLGERVAVILTLPLPKQQFRSQVQWLPADAQTVRTTINDLRRRLEKRSDLSNTYQERSQQLYDWLIRPFAEDLQAAQIETLVFIQDGILRSIPMAALHDGKQFLIEQYAIASTLSLTLIDPMQMDRTSLRVLGFGLTKPSVVEGPTYFAPLSYVKAELDSIQEAIPGSKGLLDNAFTLDRLQQELTQNAYPIVHLATHGRFGIDARDTFLVTGRRREVRGERREGYGIESTQPAALETQPYNEKLTMNALYQMLRSMPQGKVLELLTLTACETAVGSDRDALGIAGISLQAGARSTVASLWQVDDNATAQLITHFYQALKQGMSRAKALQAAQKTWLREHQGDRHHPGYWAALILVGNWL